MTKKNYAITKEQKMQYAGLFVLETMINASRSFPVSLEREDSDLEPIFEWLMAKEYSEIKDNKEYVASLKGREVLKRFMARYTDFLKIFDIYCAVDLEKGEFAFSHFFDFTDSKGWKEFLQKERWDDLRVAVAEFKKIDPVEVVFMSFLSENRFGTNKTGWQFDLLLGTFWDDLLVICNSAISADELGYEDDEGVVSGEDVLLDILRQGTEITIQLREEEAKKEEDFDDDTDSYDDSGIEPVWMEEYPMSHYYAYRDPYYISPVWRAFWIL